VKDLLRSPLVIIAAVGLLVLGAASFFLLRDNDPPSGASAGRSANLPPSTSELGTIAFPDDANIVNVQDEPYNAKGDGSTDDTAALNRAIQDNDCETAVFRSAPKTVYVPAGTYRITDSVAADNCGVRLVGAGQDQTILRLDDSAEGFDSPGDPKIVLQSGNLTSSDPSVDKNPNANRANTGFSNYYQHFTLDTGADNPGAIGIRFDVANSGAMQHVGITTGDEERRGKYGLFFTSSPGPALVQHVSIDGFESGIYLDDKIVNDLMFQDIVLSNQTVAGITNATKNIVVEGLTTQNVPTAIATTDAAATVMIFDSALSGQGSGTAIDVQQEGFVYARNITAEQFGNVVTVAGQDLFVGKNSVVEWSSHEYRVGNEQRSWTEGNDNVGLNLPVKQAPEFFNADFSTWANVTDFGATADTAVAPQRGGGGQGAGNQPPGRGQSAAPEQPAAPAVGGDDDGPAIQQAIDSGKETVYFPYGTYTIRTPVIVRGAVKRIDFMFSRVESGGPNGKMSVADADGDTVIIENVSSNLVFEQNGPDAVVIRNLNPSEGEFATGPNATGDLFIENAGAHAKLTLTQPISVWGRSVDRARTDWLNSGGTLWLAASNIETRWSPSSLTNGSKTEIIGGAIDNLGEVYDVAQGPPVDVTNSFFSMVIPGTLRNGGEWGYVLRDTYPSGQTNLYADDLVTLTNDQGDERIVLPLYVTPGYR
jgi:Pectate lyase superfamily protein